MQSQHAQTGPSDMQQIRTSGIVTRLENWHETYTRLNPWAHGGFIERVIHKLTRGTEDLPCTPAASVRDASLSPARLTLVGAKEKSASALRA